MLKKVQSLLVGAAIGLTACSACMSVNAREAGQEEKQLSPFYMSKIKKLGFKNADDFYEYHKGGLAGGDELNTWIKNDFNYSELYGEIPEIKTADQALEILLHDNNRDLVDFESRVDKETELFLELLTERESRIFKSAVYGSLMNNG